MLVFNRIFGSVWLKLLKFFLMFYVKVIIKLLGFQ